MRRGIETRTADIITFLPYILLLLTNKLSYKTLLLRIIYAKYKKFMLVYTRKIECLTKRVLIHYFVGVGLHTKSDFK